MSDGSDPLLLGRLAARLEHEAGFVSNDLRRWRELDMFDDPLARMSSRAVELLALCRSPRRGMLFGHDVRALAAYTEVDPVLLAGFFRRLDVAEALPAASDEAAGAILTAARDVADEESTTAALPPVDATSAAGALPGWLADVTNQFWGASESPHEFPRELELHVLLTLPIAIIETPQLRLRTIQELIGSRGGSELARLPDRRVHACLLAYAGVGAVFVDATDSPDDRRVNLAHEVAHFLTDYQVPRNRVASHDPDLLKVIDGLRSPTSAEDLSALIADIPLGVHTHLIERDATGGHLTWSTSHAEDRAEQVAWEVLAPRAHILSRAASRRADDLTDLLRADYGLPPAVAATYGRFLSRLASHGDTWLDGLGT